jgi:SAM-dependent methyltransferase
LQVDREHYAKGSYETKARWASYWHQVNEVVATGASRCLEVGIGNGFVQARLAEADIDVTTVDFDPELGPDRVGDIRDLPCADREFDVVLCAEVLEHIPFRDVPAAIAELHRVSKHAAVVSVPQTGRWFELTFRVPPFKRYQLIRRLPSRREWQFDGQHHWELGARNAPYRALSDALERHFTTRRTYVVPENPYHRFYILDRR